jgi:hypothetical protein
MEAGQIIAVATLLLLTAICSAIMDVGNFHRSTSRLPYWWNHNWADKYVNGNPAEGRRKWKILWFRVNIPVQIIDGWHFSKMLYIVAQVAAIVLLLDCSLGAKAIYLLAFGIAWNVTFSLFYEHILRTKK